VPLPLNCRRRISADGPMQYLQTPDGLTGGEKNKFRSNDLYTGAFLARSDFIYREHVYTV